MNTIRFDQESVRRTLAEFRAEGRMTALAVEIIRRLTGTYLVDVGLSVGDSPNARLGRLLSRHAADLGILKIQTNRSAYDDRRPRSRRTRCALYEL